MIPKITSWKSRGRGARAQCPIAGDANGALHKDNQDVTTNAIFELEMHKNAFAVGGLPEELRTLPDPSS